MKIEYKRDLQNNYLIIEASRTEPEEEYTLRMAEQNTVKGLLQLTSFWKDGVLYFNYEITSKQNLESLYEKKPMSSQDIFFLLSGIKDTAEDMRRYLLSPSQLLFAPELIYMQPDRGGVKLCYYVGEHDCSIRLLAEFILKKLDHLDPAAVELGYGFYDRAVQENFSLAESLTELLRSKDRGLQRQEELEEAVLEPEEESSVPFRTEEDAALFDREDTGGIPVQHAVRKKAKEKSGGKIDRLFSVIHPAVLLTSLLLILLLEAAFVYGILDLRECGGCFFLLLSAELLINRGLLRKKKEERPAWAEEEENEEYEALLDEVYQQETRPGDSIEETRILIPETEKETLRLVCTMQLSGGEFYPDICPGETPSCIGKARGEADVILPCATVSRIHARLEVRDGVCYLKDMNSKNGTFVNGKRLSPQEEYEIREEDVITFAEVPYRAVRRSFSAHRGE